MHREQGRQVARVVPTGDVARDVSCGTVLRPCSAWHSPDAVPLRQLPGLLRLVKHVAVAEHPFVCVVGVAGGLL
jgi:hypothetical protein